MHAAASEQAEYLISVEPEAAETAQHPCLQKGYPASVKLHDDCKGAV